jgi:hypothetical protein
MPPGSTCLVVSAFGLTVVLIIQENLPGFIAPGTVVEQAITTMWNSTAFYAVDGWTVH